MAGPLEVPLRELDAIFVERLAEALTAAAAQPAAALPVRPTLPLRPASWPACELVGLLLRPAVESV